jgi:hypothetical protein
VPRAMRVISTPRMQVHHVSWNVVFIHRIVTIFELDLGFISQACSPALHSQTFSSKKARSIVHINKPPSIYSMFFFAPQNR